MRKMGTMPKRGWLSETETGGEVEWERNPLEDGRVSAAVPTPSAFPIIVQLPMKRPAARTRGRRGRLHPSRAAPANRRHGLEKPHR